jgi:hypothetical protein
MSATARTPATTTPEIAGKPVTAGTSNDMNISNSRGVNYNMEASNSKNISAFQHTEKTKKKDDACNSR